MALHNVRAHMSFSLFSLLHDTQLRNLHFATSYSSADMAHLAKDLYLEVYEECCKLHDQKKWKDCIALCHHNLSDDSMPRFLQMKTLLLLTGAVDDWRRAEVRD